MNEKEQFFNMLGINDDTGINNNGNMMPTTSEYNPMNGIIPEQGNADMQVDSFFNSLTSEPNKPKQTKFTEHPLDWTAKRMGGGAAGMIGSLGHAITWLDNDNEIGAKMGAWGDKKAEDLMEGDDSIGAGVVSSIPFMIAAWVPGLGAASATTRLATLAKASPRMASVIGQSIGTLTPTALEAFTEAGDKYNEAMEKYGNEQMASDVASETFWKNMALVGGTNAAEMAASFGWFKKTPIIGNLAGAIDKIENPRLKIGIKAVLSGGIEGAQEYGQEYVGDTSLGEQFDPTAKKNVNAFAAGAILGGAFGGGGAYMEQRGAQNQATREQFYQAVNDSNLPDDVKAQYLQLNDVGQIKQVLSQMEGQPSFEQAPTIDTTHEDKPYWNLAVAVSQKTGLPPEWIWAQWAHETQGFSSRLTRENNNFGGLTQEENNGEDNKQPDGGNYYMQFGSPEEYANYFADYIKKYGENGINNAQTIEEYAQALKDGGYYGADVSEYVNGMRNALGGKMVMNPGAGVNSVSPVNSNFNNGPVVMDNMGESTPQANNMQNNQEEVLQDSSSAQQLENIMQVSDPENPIDSLLQAEQPTVQPTTAPIVQTSMPNSQEVANVAEIPETNSHVVPVNQVQQEITNAQPVNTNSNIQKVVPNVTNENFVPNVPPANNEQIPVNINAKEEVPNSKIVTQNETITKEENIPTDNSNINNNQQVQETKEEPVVFENEQQGTIPVSYMRMGKQRKTNVATMQREIAAMTNEINSIRSSKWNKSNPLWEKGLTKTQAINSLENEISSHQKEIDKAIALHSSQTKKQTKEIKKKNDNLDKIEKAYKSGKMNDVTYEVAKELFSKNNDISINHIGKLTKAVQKVFNTDVKKDEILYGAHRRVNQGAVKSIVGLFEGHNAWTVTHEFAHAKWYDLTTQEQQAFTDYAMKTKEKWEQKTNNKYEEYETEEARIKERFADEWSGYYFAEKKQSVPNFIQKIFHKMNGWFNELARLIDYVENSNVPTEIKTIMKKSSAGENVESKAGPTEKQKVLSMESHINKKNAPKSEFDAINKFINGNLTETQFRDWIEKSGMKKSSETAAATITEGLKNKNNVYQFPSDSQIKSYKNIEEVVSDIKADAEAKKKRKKKPNNQNNIAKAQQGKPAPKVSESRHSIDPAQPRNSLRDYSSVRFGYGSLLIQKNMESFNKLKAAGWLMEIDPISGDTLVHRPNINMFQQKEFVVQGVVRKPDRHIYTGKPHEIILREAVNVYNDLYTGLVEEQHPISILEKMDADAKGLSKDMWYATRGASSMALGYIEYGDSFTYKDKSGQNKTVNVKALKKILEQIPKEQWADFENYAIAKRTIELVDKHKVAQKMTRGEAESIVNQWEKKNAKFETVLKEMVDFNNGLLHRLVEGGFITNEQFQYYVNNHEWYVPFKKDLNAENLDNMMLQISQKKIVNIPDQIEQIQSDTTHRLVSPVKTMLEMAFTRFSAVERNKVGQTLFKLSQKKELFDILHEVNAPSSSREGVFHVWVNGEKKYIQANRTLYNVLSTMNYRQADVFTKFISTPAKWLRFGATSTPVFAIKNFVRDMLTAFVFSKNGFIPIYDSFGGLWEVFKGKTGKFGGSQTYQEWVKNGGAFSAIQSVDLEFQDYTSLAKDISNAKTTKVEKAWEKVKSPFKAMMLFSEMMEQANRVGDFKNARAGHTGLINRLFGGTKSHISMQEAILNSRDLTIDFQRAGTWGKTWNQYTAFFNAGIQGIDKFGRWTSEELKGTYNAILGREGWTKPADTAVKIGAIIMLTLLSRALMGDDDKFKEESRSMKDLYWYFPGPDGTMIRVPKPFEVGFIFGSLTDRILDFHEKKDKRAYDNLLKTMVEIFTPPMIPNLMKLFLEPMVNYSFFTERKIVPDSELKRPGYLQYGPYTSELAKKFAETGIAKSFDMSARKIDYIAGSLMGTLGRTGVHSLDVIAGKNLPDKHWYEEGGAFNPAGAFLYSGPKTFDSVEDLYKRREELDKLKAEVDFKRKPAEPYSKSEHARVEQASRKIADINKKIKAITDDENMNGAVKRRYIEAYEKQIVLEAKRGLGQR